MSFYVRNEKTHLVERLEDITIIFVNETTGKKDFYNGGKPPLTQEELWRLIQE